MLANYFSNGLHLKTAIVSSCYDDAFDRIKEEVQTCKVKNYAGSRKGFSYKGIDFFSGVRQGFVHIITEYYDVVIVEVNLADMKDRLADGLVSAGFLLDQWCHGNMASVLKGLEE